MKIRTEKVIAVDEWDALVTKTYGRPYNFQQQDGCKSRGVFRIRVPEDADDYETDTIPEIVNHDEMGVSFAAWIKRDPAELIPDDDDYSAWTTPPTKEQIEAMQKSSTRLWWERNFYPDVQMIANDLNSKGLLDAGEYTLDIDW